jgi:hypothetical protein
VCLNVCNVCVFERVQCVCTSVYTGVIACLCAHVYYINVCNVWQSQCDGKVYRPTRDGINLEAY